MKRFAVISLALTALIALTGCQTIMNLFGRNTTSTTVAVTDTGWVPAMLSAPTVPEWTRGKLWLESVQASATNYLLLCVAEDAVKSKAFDAADNSAAMRRAWDSLANEWAVQTLAKAAGRAIGDADPAAYFSKTVAEISARLPEPTSGLLVQSYWEQGSYSDRADSQAMFRVYLQVSFSGEKIRGILKEAWKNSSSAYSAEVKTKIEGTLKFLAN